MDEPNAFETLATLDEPNGLNELDEQLLRQGLMAPPADFTEQLMARLHDSPPPAWASESAAFAKQPCLRWAQGLLLATASAAGLAELASFVFGLWAASSAG